MPVLLLIAFLGAAPPPSPRLVGPSRAVGSGEVVPLRIVAVLPTGIRVDTCAPVELERHEGDAWITVPVRICEGSPAATEVAKELTISLPPPAAGEYRAVLGWGADCLTGQPFPLSACAKLGSVRSAPFTVQAAPASTEAQP